MDEYSKMHQVDLEFKWTELYKFYEVVSETFWECGRWRTQTHEPFSSSWQNFNFSFSHTPGLAALRCTLCCPGYMALQILKRDSQTELQLQKCPHSDRKQTNPGPDKARKTRTWIHRKMPDQILLLKWHWKTHNTHIKMLPDIKCAHKSRYGHGHNPASAQTTLLLSKTIYFWSFGFPPVTRSVSVSASWLKRSRGVCLRRSSGVWNLITVSHRGRRASAFIVASLARLAALQPIFILAPLLCAP